MAEVVVLVVQLRFSTWWTGLTASPPDTEDGEGCSDSVDMMVDDKDGGDVEVMVSAATPLRGSRAVTVSVSAQ